MILGWSSQSRIDEELVITPLSLCRLGALLQEGTMIRKSVLLVETASGS